MKLLLSLTVSLSLIMGQFAEPFRSATFQASDPTGTLTQSITETPPTEPPATEASVSPTETVTVTAEAPTSVTETPSATETPTPVLTSAVTQTTSPTVTATASAPTVEIPSLSLVADPTFITPGGNLLIDWTIQGVSLAGQSLVLKITIPQGLNPQADTPGIFDETTRTLTIPVTVLSGEIHLKTSQSVGDVTVSAVLMKASETLASANLPLSTHEEFVVDKKGATIKAQKGKLKVTIPTDTFDAETLIDIGAPGADTMPVSSLIGPAFEINAKEKQSNTTLHQLRNKVNIEIQYDDLNIPEEKIANLFLYWYNPETQEWEALQSSADPQTKTLKGITDHFSVFAVGLNEWQAARMPTVDDFQVSNFTGAATFSLPIEVPAGPGGFQPSLTLSYNSQVVDQATQETQASWVGMGWSLETGSIELNTADTAGSLDDTYFINVGGISARLMPDPNNAGIYRAADENFWKYYYDATGDKWTVQDKVGNIYYFEEKTTLYYPKSSCKDDGSQEGGVGSQTYQWVLTRVKNIYQKELTYTYEKETKSIGYEEYSNGAGHCNDYSRSSETAIFPKTIVYPNGRNRIFFEREPRFDYPSAWDTDGAHHSYERSRLKNIYIQFDSSGAGFVDPAQNTSQTVRQYNFQYESDSRKVIFPGYAYTTGGRPTSLDRVSTLKQVQEFGLGGSLASPAYYLPAHTFTYGDGLHMTQASNGYGGSVEFVYENDPSHTGAYWPSYYAQTTTAGNTITEDCPEHSWSARDANSSVSPDCDNSNSIIIGGSAIHNSLSTKLTRPGGVYRLSVGRGSSPASSVAIGFFDGYHDYYSPPFTTTGTLSYLFYLPADAAKMQMLIVSSGYTTKFSGFKFELLPSFYRVKQKNLSDGQGHTYTYSYSYQNAAMNDNAHSSVCATGQLNCTDLVDPYTEFRGHSQVTETGPDGKQTTTFYFQDDAYKGQPSEVDVRDAASQLLTQAIYSYPTTPIKLPRWTYPTYTYLGFDHYWVYPTSVANLTYAKNGTYTATQQTYTYESTYGNLTQQADQAWNGSSWATYRTTTTEYYFNAVSYLVGFPARQQIKDSGNAVISDTLNFYDSNSVYNAAPTLGKLMTVRSWVDGALTSGRYSQVSYNYDAWGNQTTITTYSGYGTASVAPSTGGRTTYTCYGDGTTLGGKACNNDFIHAYPLWTKNPLGQETNWIYDYNLGVPLNETDPNGNTAVAAYDAFGRMISLIRPGPNGDNSTYPTILITYNDTVQPFRIDLYQRIEGTRYYTTRKFYDGMGRLIQNRTSNAQVNGQNKLIVIDYGYNASGDVTQQSSPYTLDIGTAYSPSFPDPTTTTYDALGRPLTVSGPDGSATTYSYNGLTSTVTDANYHTTTTTTDEWGRVVSVVPPTGPSVSYTYDALDRLTNTTRAGLTTTLTYDNVGRKTTMTDPDMGYWTYQYDAIGNLTTQTDARNCALTLGYDNLNRLTSKSSSGSGCGTQVSTTFTYDSTSSGNYGRGLRTGMADASGSTTWVYDARGRLVTETKTISSSSFTTQWTYNSANLPVSITYPDNETVTYNYNNQMLLNSLVSGTTNYVQSTIYDAAGRIDLRTFGTSPNTTQTDYVYYPWSQQGGRLQYIKSGTTTNTTSLQNLNYAYDPVGNVRTIIDPLNNNETQTFGYDALDRLIAASASGTPSTGAYGESYRYDPLTGNLASKAPEVYTPPAPNPGTTGLSAWWSMDETSGVRSDSHNDNDLTDNNTVASTSGLKGNAASFTAGSNESLTVADNPGISGGNIDFTLVANVYLTNNTNTFVIIDKSDGGNIGDYRLAHNSGTGFRFRAGSVYVDSGAVTANAWHTVFAWHDSVNDTINIQVDSGTVHTLAFSTGTSDTAYPLAIGAFPNGSTELSGRIDEVAIYKRVLTAQERTWLYNSGQGRTYAEVSPAAPSALTYTYGDTAHKHAVTAFSGNTYQYDANGNMTTRVIGTNTYLLSYDAENRLTEVKKNGTSVASFVYDGDGKRVKSTLGNETALFVGNYYQQTTVGSITTITKYYYAGTTRVAMRVGSTLSYLFSDHLGSSSLATDASGNKIANSDIRYKAWGEVRLPTNGQNPGPSKYTYTGQYSNVDDFGLLYYGARWYDPCIMQFNQPDSIIPDPYNTLDWNRYAYARYNPSIYTDPTGHDPVHEFFGGLLKELARTNFWWHPGYQRDLAIHNNESTAELTGRLVADVASIGIGAWEAGGGAGVAGGGVLACATGVGCPAGAVGIAGGGVLIYQGAGTALNAGNNAGTIITMLSRGSGNSSLRNFASDDFLQDDFDEHGNSFNGRYKTKEEYLEGARDFFARKGIEKVDRPRDGATLYYDRNTNEFGILDKNGTITTYYAPDEDLDYWFRQVQDAKRRR